MNEWLAGMTEARGRFLELVAEVRPELHRYCARMTGSVFDGEDIVQETLAKAYYALPELEAAPTLRPWLFRIAHNTALDFLRRYEQRHVVAVEDMTRIACTAPEQQLDDERVEAALELFAALPPLQRSALALKDVLGLSLEETAEAMELSVAAVKAALVRARGNVSAAAQQSAPRQSSDLPQLRHYATLFNARDWDGLRALMSEEARLELVSRWQRRGKRAADYYSTYAHVAPTEGLRAVPGFVDGAAVLALYRGSDAQPAYFMQLRWEQERVTHLRDFYFVPYIAREARFSPA